ncbi:MAG: DUF3014 domain-containing protein [Gammaproteobacteria bacterium]|nr:DUF3014 domain-containing protein [Gammaproteobacteria bacterium]
MNRKILAVAAVVVLAVILFLVFKPSEPEKAVVEETVIAPAPAPAVVQAPAPVEPQPPAQPPTQLEVEEPPIPTPETLDESDDYVVAAVEKLSPPLLQWIVPEEQVRKLVLAVDVLAEGKLPQRHKPVEIDLQAFKVEELNGKYELSDANLDRLTPLIDSIVAIDPKTLGQHYHAWMPLLEKAYGELGKQDSFKARVDRVIKRIQEAGPAPVDATLVRPHVFYEYSDPALENRSALEKWLWRMGDENREKLQAYLRELKFYL